MEISRVRLIFCFFILHLLCFSEAEAQNGAFETIIQKGHSNTVSSVFLSKDLRTLITAGWDGAVILWDIFSGRERDVLQAHEGDINHAELSPDGRSVLTAGADGTARIWDLESRRELICFNDGDILYSARFSPDGKRVLTCGDGDFVRMWNAATGELLWEKELREGFVPCFHPDGRSILMPLWNGDVVLLEVEEGNETVLFSCHADVVNQVQFDREGRRFLSTSRDSTAKLFEFPSGRLLKVFHGHAGYVDQAIFSPDEKRILTVHSDFTLRLWDTETGAPLRTLSDEAIVCASFHPNGHYVMTGSTRMAAKLWDIESGGSVRSYQGYADHTYGASFLDETKIFSWYFDYGKIWDLSTARQSKSSRFGFANNFSRMYSLSPSRERALSLNASFNRAILWHLPSIHPLRIFTSDSARIEWAAMSPDENCIVTGGGKDHFAVIWDAGSGREVRRLYAPGRRFDGGAFDSEGRILALSELDPWGYFKEVSYWDVASLRKIDRVEDTRIASASFGPDGKTIVFRKPFETMLWDKTRHQKMKMNGEESFNDFAVCPDGRTFFTRPSQSLLKQYDMESRQEIRSFEGHTGWLTTLDVSPDGRDLLSAGSDYTLRLWDIGKGSEEAQFISAGEEDYIILTPDHYYTASKDGLKAVQFRTHGKMFPFEQFDLRWNRPDIVLSRLGRADPKLIAAYRKSYEKRLKRMGFTEEEVQGEIHMPEIDIAGNSLPVETDSGMVFLDVRMIDNKTTLDRLNVFVNDVPVYGTNGIPLKEHKKRTISRVVPVILSQGLNKIQVSCHNRQGVESLRETVEIICREQRQKPDLYVIALGVSHYVNPDFDLEYAASDARNVAGLFENPPAGLYGNIYTRLVTDDQVVLENLFALREMIRNSRVDDTVILFYAGHGLLDSDLNYILGTHDIDFFHPSGRGFAYENLESLLDGIPARRKLVLIDACHSGEVEEEAFAESTALPEKIRSRAVRGFIEQKEKEQRIRRDEWTGLLGSLFADLRRGIGAMAISSSSGEEYSFESGEWQGGVFTALLLQGLKDRLSDLDGDGQIRVSEIQRFLAEKVQTLTLGRQTPTFRRENLADDFRVW